MQRANSILCSLGPNPLSKGLRQQDTQTRDPEDSRIIKCSSKTEWNSISNHNLAERLIADCTKTQYNWERNLYLLPMQTLFLSFPIAAPRRVQTDTVMPVIKELSLTGPDNRKRHFLLQRTQWKYKRRALIFRMWRSFGRVCEGWVTVVVTSAWWWHFYCQHFCTKLEEAEQDEFFFFSPLGEVKMTHRWSCRSSHNSLQLGSSLSTHYGDPMQSVVCLECVVYCYHSGGGWNSF